MTAAGVAKRVATLPKTRAECVDGPRPCPHTTCRYHVASGRPDASCALDLADRGERTLEEVGELLGMTREGARLIEKKALGTFVLRAHAIGVVDRLPQFGERPRMGLAQRPVTPSPLAVEDDSDDEGREDRPFASFFDDSRTDAEVLRSIHLMIDKRHAEPDAGVYDLPSDDAVYGPLRGDDE